MIEVGNLPHLSANPARKIAVLTVGRSDFSRYLPVLKALRARADVSLRLLATGAHFSAVYGDTWREIVAAGFEFEAGLESTLTCDTPVAVGKAIGLATASLAQSFARDRPDLLVLLGDRFEMLSGANAALGFNLPVAHIHGGAVTEGAIDELVRHAITKMSHLHLVSTEVYAIRVRQMGEEDWRVRVVGAPGLDELPELVTFDRQSLTRETGLDLSNGFMLLSYHSVTLELDCVDAQINAVLEALADFRLPAIITYPNADPGSQTIISAIGRYSASHTAQIKVFVNAGARLYTSLMAHATAMVGNSSSGLVEAPTFKLPVVNIGSRQNGKIKAANVIDCGYSAAEISAALAKAASPAFRATLAKLVNPYGDGHAGSRIADILAAVPLDNKLLRKRFIDR